MPDYVWICNACQASNAAGIDRCSKCNCPAHATGIEISTYSSREEEARNSPSRPSQKIDKEDPSLVVVCCLLGSLWLIAGAIYQLALHTYFPLFPIQIDGIFGFTKALFGTDAGLYVSSFLAGFVGVLLLWFGISGLRKHG